MNKAYADLVQTRLTAYIPLWDHDQKTIGFELLTDARRGTEAGEKTAPNDMETSVEALITAFIHCSLKDLLLHRKFHVKTPLSFLLSEAIHQLPPDSIAFELMPTESIPNEAFEVFQGLNDAGYELTIDQLVPDDSRLVLLPYVQNVTLSMSDPEAARLAEKHLSYGAANLIATDVDTEADFQLARTLHATCFKGHYFQVPHFRTPPRLSLRVQTIIALINELNSDGSDKQVEAFFKENPTLSLKLLEMVNKAATGFNLNLTSIKQAIAILGRKQLERWLQILLFTLDETGNTPSALIESALWRAKFLEHLSHGYAHTQGAGLEDLAFITGILSLGDVLLSQSQAAMLSALHVSYPIEAAIVRGEGPLGDMLNLAKSLEVADFDSAGKLAKKLKLSTSFIVLCQNNAHTWSNRLVVH